MKRIFIVVGRINNGDGAGTHKVTVKAWDTAGRKFSSSRNVSVQ
jgi:hypothetical protein